VRTLIGICAFPDQFLAVIYFVGLVSHLLIANSFFSAPAAWRLTHIFGCPPLHSFIEPPYIFQVLLKDTHIKLPAGEKLSSYSSILCQKLSHVTFFLTKIHRIGSAAVLSLLELLLSFFKQLVAELL